MDRTSSRHGPTSDADARRARIELEILRTSLSHRIRGTGIAVPGALIAIAAFSTALKGQLPDARLLTWAAPLTALMLIRGILAWRAGRVVETGDSATLARADARLRASSIANQAWMGAGVWICGGHGAEVDLFVTLAICIFGTGAAVSLTHDARTVALSIPLLFGQAIAFWLLKGPAGYHISILLIPVMLLIIASSRRSQENLDESIEIRFENDALLQQLEAEKEIAIAAARAAEEANRSKSLFMAAASHDLRQPLYAITLLADTLGLHALPEQARAIVEQQGRSLEVLTHMFDNLLDLSRFDSGDVEAHVEPVFLRDVIADLLTEFLPVCENKGLVLETNALDDWVESDVDLLGRLLRNLISNAVRYTDTGSVSVTAHLRGDRVTVEVRDTGFGIDVADQQRIFQEFVQLHNPGRNRERGVGLGLSIVHRIAELLGHEIRLSSSPHVGTTVSVTLPLAEAPTAGQRRPRFGVLDATPITDDIYVWIVEDDMLVRNALSAHFDALGVRHAFGRDRVELETMAAETGWPDFAVLDDMLGFDETGLDLARWLSPHVSKERILLVTGNTDPMRVKELEGSGFQMMRKPVSSENLKAWLRSGIDGAA